MQIHVARDGKQLGVFSVEEIRQQLASGTLHLSDLGWYEGAAGWAPLASVPEVSAPAVPASPASTTSATTTSGSAVVPPQSRIEPLALASLICSIAGLLGFCCGFLLLAGIAGIVCGHLALSKIKHDPQLEGHGLALAGLIIGYVAVGGWLAWILLFGGLAVLHGISESMMRH